MSRRWKYQPCMARARVHRRQPNLSWFWYMSKHSLMADVGGFEENRNSMNKTKQIECNRSILEASVIFVNHMAQMDVIKLKANEMRMKWNEKIHFYFLSTKFFEFENRREEKKDVWKRHSNGHTTKLTFECPAFSHAHAHCGPSRSSKEFIAFPVRSFDTSIAFELFKWHLRNVFPFFSLLSLVATNCWIALHANESHRACVWVSAFY